MGIMTEGEHIKDGYIVPGNIFPNPTDTFVRDASAYIAETFPDLVIRLNRNAQGENLDDWPQPDLEAVLKDRYTGLHKMTQRKLLIAVRDFLAPPPALREIRNIKEGYLLKTKAIHPSPSDLFVADATDYITRNFPDLVPRFGHDVQDMDAKNQAIGELTRRLAHYYWNLPSPTLISLVGDVRLRLHPLDPDGSVPKQYWK